MAPPRITKEEAARFRERWALVRRAEIEELRSTPPEVKIRQLAALMASVREMGWDEALAAEDEEVWARWQRLREILGG